MPRWCVRHEKQKRQKHKSFVKGALDGLPRQFFGFPSFFIMFVRVHADNAILHLLPWDITLWTTELWPHFGKKRERSTFKRLGLVCSTAVDLYHIPWKTVENCGNRSFRVSKSVFFSIFEKKRDSEILDKNSSACFLLLPRNNGLIPYIKDVRDKSESASRTINDLVPVVLQDWNLFIIESVKSNRVIKKKKKWSSFVSLFRCVLSSQYEALSVYWSVRPSIRPSVRPSVLHYSTTCKTRSRWLGMIGYRINTDMKPLET